MINKKNVLGKEPHELGDKDAIHVAIVAVRAAEPIAPGTRCGVNEFGEAVPKEKGVGVADPFRRSHITTGQSFWLLLDQDAVPNVRHVWEHPSVAFAAPTREPVLNRSLVDIAKQFGLTYQQLLDACSERFRTEKPVEYVGTLNAEELLSAVGQVDEYELWSEWSYESGNEFENNGTECCPEYDYPPLPFAK
jgi:hypothetical protein